MLSYNYLFPLTSCFYFLLLPMTPSSLFKYWALLASFCFNVSMALLYFIASLHLSQCFDPALSTYFIQVKRSASCLPNPRLPDIGYWACSLRKSINSFSQTRLVWWNPSTSYRRPWWTVLVLIYRILLHDAFKCVFVNLICRWYLNSAAVVKSSLMST